MSPRDESATHRSCASRRSRHHPALQSGPELGPWPARS